MTLGGGTTADTVVTAPELAGLTPAVSFPALGVVVNPATTAPTFTCTNGNITSAGGTLTVN